MFEIYTSESDYERKCYNTQRESDVEIFEMKNLYNKNGIIIDAIDIGNGQTAINYLYRYKTIDKNEIMGYILKFIVDVPFFKVNIKNIKIPDSKITEEIENIDGDYYYVCIA